MQKAIHIRRIALTVGIILITAAVFSFVYMKVSADKSAERNAETAEFLEELLPARTVGIKQDLGNPIMPSVSYNGSDYIALLEIPAQSVKLPIASLWNKYKVDSVPCRFTGSAYDGTLIIGGTDSIGQFDFISDIDIEDGLILTDMKGEEFYYKVKKVNHSKNADAETLIDNNYDLTLFSNSKKTNDYIILRCDIESRSDF